MSDLDIIWVPGFGAMAQLEKATEVPYGSWKSPLTAGFVSGASKRLEGAMVDSRGRLLLLEGRSSEEGRSKNQSRLMSLTFVFSKNAFIVVEFKALSTTTAMQPDSF